jgi:Fe-S oxidoreductase
MALLLQRFNDRRKNEKSLPLPIEYMINGMSGSDRGSNFYLDVYKSHNKKQKDILEKWGKPKESGDIIWCGCVSRMFPDYIENSKILADIPKFGGGNDCCGNIAVKSGLFDEAKVIASDLIKTLSKSKFSRIIVLCGSCQETFVSYYPDYLGMDFPFQTISIYEYLEEQITLGKIPVMRKLNIDAAVSDSCFGGVFDENFAESIGRLCGHIGIKITPLAHGGKDAACCGINALYRKGKIKDVLDAGIIKRKDIRAAGKKDLLTYCYGCTMTLNSSNFTFKTHFLLEKVLWALGDEVNISVNSLFRKMMNARSIYGMLKIGPSALF